MSKAKKFINTQCYQLGNPVEPLIFKADAIEAVRIESDEVEKRAIEAYRQLCPCYQNGKCKNIRIIRNRERRHAIWNVCV